MAASSTLTSPSRAVRLRFCWAMKLEAAMPTLLPASSEMLSPRRVDATWVTEELPLAFAEELKPSVPVEDFF